MTKRSSPASRPHCAHGETLHECGPVDLCPRPSLSGRISHPCRQGVNCSILLSESFLQSLVVVHWLGVLHETASSRAVVNNSTLRGEQHQARTAPCPASRWNHSQYWAVSLVCRGSGTDVSAFRSWACVVEHSLDSTVRGERLEHSVRTLTSLHWARLSCLCCGFCKS